MQTSEILLIGQVGPKTGLGHLSRLIVVAEELIKNNVNAKLIIFGKLTNNRIDSIDLNISANHLEKNFFEVISKEVTNNNYSSIILDLNPRELPSKTSDTIFWLNDKNIDVIGIDSLFEYSRNLKFIWVPSFYDKFSKNPLLAKKVICGWDSYLLNKRLEIPKWKSGNKVLVLTGASDTKNLYKTLPYLIEKDLSKKMEITWVRGPYAKKPKLPKNLKHEWQIEFNPNRIDNLICSSNYVLTVFGVSFFETIQYGIPSIVFSPYDQKDFEELKSLSKEGVCIVSANLNNAVKDLDKLIQDISLSQTISKTALKKMNDSGAKNLVKKVLSNLKK